MTFSPSPFVGAKERRALLPPRFRDLFPFFLPLFFNRFSLPLPRGSVFHGGSSPPPLLPPAFAIFSRRLILAPRKISVFKLSGFPRFFFILPFITVFFSPFGLGIHSTLNCGPGQFFPYLGFNWSHPSSVDPAAGKEFFPSRSPFPSGSGCTHLNRFLFLFECRPPSLVTPSWDFFSCSCPWQRFLHGIDLC